MDDIEIINTELILADIKTIERSLEKNVKLIKANKPEGRLAEEVLTNLLQHMNEGLAARSFERNTKENPIIKNLFLLTDKPMIYVANIDDETNNINLFHDATEVAKKNRSSIIEINGKLESEMADFSEEEKKLILEDYGIKESGLDSLIREAYDTLGLNTFFTCGEKEVRAWTMKKGAQAVEAAGEIHSDFATKFIKAEIYTYQDAINNREKINELKTMGLVKMVGRDYIMQEGDIAYFIKGQ